MVKGLEPLLVDPGVLVGVQTVSTVSFTVFQFLQCSSDDVVGRICLNGDGQRRPTAKAGRLSKWAKHSPFFGRRRGIGGRSVKVVIPGN